MKTTTSSSASVPTVACSPVTRFERFAQVATAYTERWIPDPFIFALAGTLLILLAVLTVDPVALAHPGHLIDAWGNGFWSLISFTLQTTMMIIGGYVLASSRPMSMLVGRLARIPRGGKSAVVLVAVVAMASSLLNWGFSLIFSAILAREVARRVPTADYRALGASSFLGLGTVWAQGLSSSAALQMASASSMPPQLARLVGVIPLTDTIFTWQSVTCVVLEIAVVTALMWMCAPARSDPTIVAARVGAQETPREVLRPPRTPGEYFEHSPVLLLPVAVIGLTYLARTIGARAGSVSAVLNALDFNTINLFVLMFGALLHWTPASLMRAVREATPAASGVLLQYPFYAGIFGLITSTHLSSSIAAIFVGGSSTTWFPATICAYSAVLGVFVPSAGAKWIIEAPYVLESARTLHVSAGWTVVAYNLGEAIANLVQPFWMLPVLGVLGLKARDIMGYTFLVALVLFPIALVLVTVLAPRL